jgi:hypothetical protein
VRGCWGGDLRCALLGAFVSGWCTGGCIVFLCHFEGFDGGEVVELSGAEDMVLLWSILECARYAACAVEFVGDSEERSDCTDM